MRNQSKPGQPILAASYARKATSDPIGLKAQHAINQKAAEANGHQLPLTSAYVFEDDCTTGQSKDRDGLTRLRKLVESGNAPFSHLYVVDETRFGRWANLRVRSAFEQFLLRHGIQLHYGNKPVTAVDEASSESAIWQALKKAFRAFVEVEGWKKLLARLRTGKADRV